MANNGGFRRWWRRQNNVAAALVLGVFLTAGVGENIRAHKEEAKLTKQLITAVENAKKSNEEGRETGNALMFQPPLPVATNANGQVTNSGFTDK